MEILSVQQKHSAGHLARPSLGKWAAAPVAAAPVVVPAAALVLATKHSQ